jgi:hypothetical protein
MKFGLVIQNRSFSMGEREGDRGHNLRFSATQKIIGGIENAEYGLTSNYVPTLHYTRVLQRRGTTHSPCFVKILMIVRVVESVKQKSVDYVEDI